MGAIARSISPVLRGVMSDLANRWVCSILALAVMASMPLTPLLPMDHASQVAAQETRDQQISASTRAVQIEACKVEESPYYVGRAEGARRKVKVATMHGDFSARVEYLEPDYFGQPLTATPHARRSATFTLERLLI